MSVPGQKKFCWQESGKYNYNYILLKNLKINFLFYKFS